MKLHQSYHPVTATPFTFDDNYMEFAPCDALKPYVRCFWGTMRPVRQQRTDGVTKRIITPDTCMDIIFDVDFTNNTIEDRFCGIDDRTFSIVRRNDADKKVFSFAIRFYAWGVSAFSEESLRDTRNGLFDVGCHFSRIKKQVQPFLFDVKNIYELIPVVEKILLENYDGQKENAYVLQAIEAMIRHKGNLTVGELTRRLHIGDRQLQRLFREYVGVSPKSLASMVRYQYLWNDVLSDQAFDIHNAVYRYGYSDQAHLLHDFRKYHSMNIADARNYAAQHVGNIQEKAAAM